MHGWLQLRCSQTIFLDGPSLDGQVRPVYLFRPAELVYLFRLVELGWLTAAGLSVFYRPSSDCWLQPNHLVRPAELGWLAAASLSFHICGANRTSPQPLLGARAFHEIGAGACNAQTWLSEVERARSSSHATVLSRALTALLRCSYLCSILPSC